MKFVLKASIYLVGVTLALAASLPVSAASVSALASKSTIQIGESTTVDLLLNLGPEEAASVFEGTFPISGLDTVVSANISAIGPTWPNAASNILNDSALFSLTSNNNSDPTRLLATLGITGLSNGVSEITFDSSTFAAFDIPTFPFSQNLVLTNTSGEVLAGITVVPEPSAVLLLLLGLGFLLCRRFARQV